MEALRLGSEESRGSAGYSQGVQYIIIIIIIIVILFFSHKDTLYLTGVQRKSRFSHKISTDIKSWKAADVDRYIKCGTKFGRTGDINVRKDGQTNVITYHLQVTSPNVVCR